MKFKVVTGITLTLLLIGMLMLAFKIQPVKAELKTWTVDDDGPADFSKIQDAINAASSGDTVFVYNGTYSEYVFVNKSLTLIGENANATIIEGVLGEKSVIKCYNVSDVKISRFTIRQGSQYGIFLENSRNITISDNMILNNGIRGVYLRSSSNNTFSNNTVSNHSQYGIYVYNFSSNNVVSHNIISNTNIHGIWLRGHSDNNIISDNLISKNTHGLYIVESTGNTLKNNNITGNTLYNFLIDGRSLSEFIHDIDASNMVDGKPVYYWVNQHDKQVPSDAGYVALVNSTNITVKDLNLAKNRQGVLIAYTTNSTVMNVNASYNYIGIHIQHTVLESSNNSVKSNILTSNQKGIESIESNDNTLTHNTITNNDWGIYLYWSSNNSIYGNNIANNGNGTWLSMSSNNSISGNTITNNVDGVWLEGYSNYNTIYHNYFINNTKQVQVSTSSNMWDDGYPSGGNYWSDYSGTDLYSGPYQNETSGDGIGDTPYLIPEDNKDNYPLMTPVMVDQIIIDERCDVGSLQTIAFHAIWAQNRSSVVGGSVYVNSTQQLTNSTGWISFNATRDTVGKFVWIVTSFGSFYVIWDRVQIVEGGSSRTETTITETETIWFKAIYEYDGSVFDGTKGTLYVNGSAMTWSAAKERWEYNCTFDTPGTRVFKISGVSDGQYGLTIINDLAGAQSITWLEVEEEEEVPFWAQWWFWTIIGVIAIAVVAIYFLRKRKPLTSTPQ